MSLARSAVYWLLYWLAPSSITARTRSLAASTSASSYCSSNVSAASSKASMESMTLCWEKLQITMMFNKYGSVQELRSTFRQFDFLLVMFHFGSE